MSKHTPDWRLALIRVNVEHTRQHYDGTATQPSTEERDREELLQHIDWQQEFTKENLRELREMCLKVPGAEGLIIAINGLAYGLGILDL